MSDDSQQRRSGVGRESGAEVFQTLQPKAQHAKGDLPLGESCERLAQVGSHLRLTGYASNNVHAARRSFFGAVDIALLERVESFDGADDRTMRVMNWNSANPDRDFISRLVVEKS